MDSTDNAATLITELQALRHDRGIQSATIDTVGPTLRAAWGIGDQDSPAEVRRKVTDNLTRLADTLPSDLRVAVLAAFALTPAANQRFTRERLKWAADELGRDQRTIQRRVKEGERRIAELAAGQLARRRGEAGAPSEPNSWHSAALRTVLLLTGEAPEAFEFRRIVADTANLREIDLAVTLTAYPPDADSTANELAMDVLYGGNLVRRTMESEHRFGMALALPGPLDVGDEHEFAVRFRIPRGQALRPHFVSVPQQSCDLLTVRVKFDEKNPPPAAWQLTRIFQNELDDPAHRTTRLPIDAAGEVQVRFERPVPGFAYGVQWDEPAAEPGGGPWRSGSPPGSGMIRRS